MLRRCLRVLSYGGCATPWLYTRVLRETSVDFGEKMLVSRVMINTSTVHGAIGLSTALSLSLTLGWGSWGGNVTSPNISLLHLMNIKRVAFGITAPCEYDFNYIPTVCSADKF